MKRSRWPVGLGCPRRFRYPHCTITFMIVDVHTHIFPPEFVADRDRLAAHDPAFGALYGNPRAAMATADDLLASMREASVDVSVASGFWWADASLAAEHCAYLIDSAARADGAILPFTPSRTAIDGSAGIGEVRESTIEGVPDAGFPLLVHCSEEVGHAYPGKSGGLTPGALWALISTRPAVRVIAAHWGGGFPFYGLMPEVREVIDEGGLIFDTAASHYLYRPEVFAAAISLVGDRAITWGSDFPLRPQADDLAAVRAAIEDEQSRARILGGNAARFLGIPTEG